jgi:hypothetical protein
MDSVQVNTKSEQFAARECAYQRLSYLEALRKSARIALALAKEAKHTQDKLEWAKMAMSRYEELETQLNTHYTFLQPDDVKEAMQAKKIVWLHDPMTNWVVDTPHDPMTERIEQIRELDKPPMTERLEQIRELDKPPIHKSLIQRFIEVCEWIITG